MRILISMLLVSAMCAAAGAQEQSKALEDWKHMDDLLATYNRYFVSEHSFSEKNAEFVNAWKEWSAEAPEFVAYFKKTYGDTPEKVEEAYEGLEAPEGIFNYPRSLASALYEIDFDALQTEVGKWLVKAGDKHYSDWERVAGDKPQDIEKRMQFAERALSAYRTAVELNPDGDYSAQVAKAEEAARESTAAFEKALQEIEWPGNNPDFEGPGDPNDLAAAALKLLEKLRDEDRTWSKPEYDDEHIPVAACVIADAWGVEKVVPVTQEPTQFRLKMLVAFRGNKDPDIAYCYPMYFYTKEEKGVEKAPPFHYCNSEQYASFRMPMANVGKGGGVIADSAPGAVGGKSAGPGLVMRLLLTAALLVGGLAASSGQVLATKAAPLSSVHSALKGMRQPLAWVVMGIGALALLLTLVNLSLFRDLLPQAAAICLGLALMSGSVSAQPAETEETPTSPSPLSKVSGALAPYEMPLGFAALALGILHLFVGGFGLL